MRKTVDSGKIVPAEIHFDFTEGYSIAELVRIIIPSLRKLEQTDYLVGNIIRREIVIHLTDGIRKYTVIDYNEGSSNSKHYFQNQVDSL